MTTLHALRRTYSLSFSELALLTAVPARRLAAFEYQGCPLSIAEQQSLASFFGVKIQALEGGFVSHVSAQPTLTRVQAQTLAMIAATAALTWSIRIAPLSARDLFRAADFEGNQPPVASNIQAPPTPTVTNTPIPTVTPRRQSTSTQQRAFRNQPRVGAVIKAPAVTATPTEVVPSAATIAAIDPSPDGITPAPEATASVSLQGDATQPVQMEALPGDIPNRCPVVPEQGQVNISQGYAIGTHAPANVWGALDLVIEDGKTEDTPVIATHAGIVTVTLNSWPGGNFVSISNDNGWRTGYAHLKTVLVQSGMNVEAGTIIGTVGSTGYSTGPHLHYETWQDGINLDPSPRLFCE